MSDEPNRRRHARVPVEVALELVIDGAPVVVARVVDASPGGALVEVASPPPLSATGRAVLRRGDASVERHARVVRIRWGGRDRGERVKPAVALVFDDADQDAAARLEALLR